MTTSPELMPVEYGQCPCEGVYEDRNIEVRLRTGEAGALVLSDIPQGRCPGCGSRVYLLAIVRSLEKLSMR